ncbi:hypothetical protein [Marinirhabdus gelatinilytica]|uniref:Uncharacterized protein n=1 Tax=Marinirhabdus gelatinilytica TaxID=1703343 RepID=A0A370QJA4_9FLAO|nr:hypothetical protein [Marinirhabdus gelatinilytica]RDK88419.1 hypothetical protein C8D94_101291 [Marinirhabdus gelatinilytica]
MTEIFDYLNGKGGLYVLGLIVVVVFLIKKIRAEMYFRSVHKKDKKKK